MYYIYMLRCSDNSIYTGITTDVERRMKEHFKKEEKCAKYTSTHIARKLEKLWSTDNRSNASKLEYNIKKLKKFQKEQLIKNNINLSDVLSEKLNCKLYRNVNFSDK